MNESPESANKHWHLDKKIQLPVIFMVVSNVFVMAWFASKMDARVAEQERRIVQLETVQTSTGGKITELTVGFGRMDERMKALLDGQNEIKEILSRGKR